MSVQTITIITPWDRLTLTLALALLLHAVIILGVTFVEEEAPTPRFDAMEVTLVYENSEAPEEATALAQASLRGGGEQTDEPLSGAKPEQAQVGESPAPETTRQQGMTTPATDNASPGEELLSIEDNLQEQIAPRNEVSVERPPEPERHISARALLTNRRQIDALSAAIKRRETARANQPRRKFISANTREHSYAQYMERWRRRVETLGNSNYPSQAIQRNLSGTLILTTALNPDGTVNTITLRKSSGHRILDEAALRIVRMGAPYSPFPEEIRKETDILHITRTWKFINNRMSY